MRFAHAVAKAAVLPLLALGGGQAVFAAPVQRFEAQLDVRCVVELDWQVPVGTYKVNCDRTPGQLPSANALRVTEGRTYQLNALLSPANTRLEDPAAELRDALADIFEKPEEAARAECHFASMMATVCRNVPAGALIRQRATASKPFPSTTGYVMCVDSVAGRGPCVPMKPQ